ncbi:MAG: DUF5678 domain-containing protein [bacterium]
MDQVLIKDKRYSGQYVVIKDFNDPTIIASGDDPEMIYEEAVGKGHREPVIVFVPDKDMVQIYVKIAPVY